MRARSREGVPRATCSSITQGGERPPNPQTRTYVLDTSVLLADPGALRRFDEHEVVLPVVVITELEGKRHHPELGYFARSALRLLDELRIAPRPARRAGAGRRGGRHAPGRAQPHRPRLAAVRLPARRQRHPDPGRGAQPGRRGLRRDAGLQGPAAAGQGVGGRAGRRGVPRRDGRRLRPRLHRDGRARGAPPPTSTSCTTTARSTSRRPASCPATPGLVLLSERGTRARPGRSRTSRCSWSAATGRRSASTAARAEQRIALDLLLDPEVGIVSLGGRAGTGKSALALCAGLEAVHGAPPAPEGRGVPAAVRRRRPGARLPAGLGVGEDVALGAGGLRHPRRGDLDAT